MIGIISYLPDDIDLRQRRFKHCQDTVNFISSRFPGQRIYCVAQNYKDEVFDNELVDVEHFEKLGPSGARNKILQKFYDSLDKWLYMSDDDVIDYDYYNSKELVSDIYNGVIDIEADMIVPLMPQLAPFKDTNMKYDIAHQFVLSPLSINSCPNIMLLRNSDVHIYYDETIDLSQDDAVSEDLKFLSECIYKGKRLYRLDSWIKKSPAQDHSTIFQNITVEANKKLHRRLTDNFNSFIKSTYKVQTFKEFNDRYNVVLRKYIVVPRKNVYEVPDNLKPIKSTNKNKLF